MLAGKFLEMESSRSMRVEKRGYEQGMDVDDDAEQHPPESKRPKLPALARYIFSLYLLISPLDFYALFSWC